MRRCARYSGDPLKPPQQPPRPAAGPRHHSFPHSRPTSITKWEGISGAARALENSWRILLGPRNAVRHRHRHRHPRAPPYLLALEARRQGLLELLKVAREPGGPRLRARLGLGLLRPLGGLSVTATAVLSAASGAVLCPKQRER